MGNGTGVGICFFVGWGAVVDFDAGMVTVFGSVGFAVISDDVVVGVGEVGLGDVGLGNVGVGDVGLGIVGGIDVVFVGGIAEVIVLGVVAVVSPVGVVAVVSPVSIDVFA